MTELDATKFYYETPADLAKQIEKAVAKTQSFFIRELPNVLKITQQQFEILMTAQEGRAYMSSVGGNLPFVKGNVEKAYIFYTPLNAMDVVIVNNKGKDELLTKEDA